MSNPTSPSDPGSQESPESGAATPAPPAPDATPAPEAPSTPDASPASKAPAAPATTTTPTTPSAPDATAASKEQPPADSSAPKPTTPETTAAEKPAAEDSTPDKSPAADKPAPTTPSAAPTTAVPAGGASKVDAGKDGSASDGAAPKVEAGKDAAGGSAADAGAGAAAVVPEGEKKVRFYRRGPFVTVAGALVVLLVLAVLGYVWGLGPLNRLNTARGITPPAKLAGLDRVTDADIRNQLQLDQTRQALSRINNGKQATVEAYGNLDGDRLFVVIALRGKVDIAKTVADSGASPDKVKKIGQATCVETTGNLPTQCYRGSNTLTVIAQSANEGITVDQVAPVAVEAFHAMK
ncbi:hypothetical protein ACFTSF_27020 [Kribbella sp. NPDC056951]|uniref:hypothetical protein n=1 Tax=Kribbella sp. NPDC056951 TaxID=3345978 RepID=UPI00363EFC6F